MKILDRYLIRLAVTLFSVVFFVMSMMVVMVKFIDELDYFTKFQASTPNIIEYLLYYIPSSFQQVIPISVVLGVMLMLLVLNINNELLALQAGGISRRRLAIIILGAAVCITGFTWLANSSLIPSTIRKMKVQKAKIEHKSDPGSQESKQTWMKAPSGDFYKIGLIADQGQELRLMAITHFNQDASRLLKDWTIAEAKWDAQKKQWRIPVLRSRTFDENGYLIEEKWDKNIYLPLEFKPSDFSQVVRLPKEMSTQQLEEHIHLLQRGGLDSRAARMNYHQRQASIWAPLLLAMIGLGYGFYMTRMEMASGIAMAIVWVVAYLMMNQFAYTLGKSNLLDPAILAWIPNVIVGSYALWRTRRLLFS